MHRLHRRDVFADDGFPAAAGRYRLSGDVPAHSHDFLEVALVIGGTGSYVRPEGSTPLRARSVLAVRPGQVHGYADCDDADVFNLYIGPELLRRELLWTLDHPDLARFLLRGGQTTTTAPEGAATGLVRWLTLLSQQRAVVGTPSAAVALGLLCCSLGELARFSFDTGSRRRAISPVVRRAWQLMVDEPSAPWRMADLADRLQVSVPHLHRCFTAEVGAPPMTWLGQNRAEIAASMLIQSDRPIAEIGRLVGWPDPNYFSRRFSELNGASPSEYRRRIRT